MTNADQNTLTINSVEAAIEQLVEQSRIADELASLARGQASLIAEGQASELLTVLERRQSLIDELLALVDRVTPLARTIQQQPGLANDRQRVQVRSLVDSIGARLEEVIEIDSGDRARLQDRLRDVQQQMTVNGSARHAHKAYGRTTAHVSTPTGTTTRFTDQQG